MLTLGNCGDYGLNWTGQGGFDVKGAVESSGPMTLSTGGGGLPQKFENTVQSACGAPNMGTGNITYMDGPATGGGGPFTNPFSAITLASLEPYCTHGHTYVNQDIAFTDWIRRTPCSRLATLNSGRLLLERRHQLSAVPGRPSSRRA